MNYKFSPHQPVNPKHFCGHDTLISTIISSFNILQPESVALLGLPLSGKTSILNYLADPIAEIKYPVLKNFLRISIQGGFLGTHSTPVNFWEAVISQVYERSTNDGLRMELCPIIARLSETQLLSGFKHLTPFVNVLKKFNQRVLMLIDDFEEILDGPNYLSNKSDFYSQFRILGQNSENMITFMIAIKRSPTILHQTAHGSHWDNAFSVYTVSSQLTSREVETIINNILTVGGINRPVTNGELNLAYCHSEMHPQLTLVIGNAILDYRQSHQNDDLIYLEKYIVEQVQKPSQVLFGTLLEYYTPEEKKALLKQRNGEILTDTERYLMDVLLSEDRMLPGVKYDGN